MSIVFDRLREYSPCLVSVLSHDENWKRLKLDGSVVDACAIDRKGSSVLDDLSSDESSTAPFLHDVRRGDLIVRQSGKYGGSGTSLPMENPSIMRVRSTQAISTLAMNYSGVKKVVSRPIC